MADHQSARKHAAKTASLKHRVPKELRSKLKHARAARGMLQDLEDDIRLFIRKWNEKQQYLQSEGLQDAPEDDSEDEIVFVGRNGQMHDSPERKQKLKQMRQELSLHHERDGEKMVFESLVDDRGAAFGYVCLAETFSAIIQITDIIFLGAGLCIPSHPTTGCIPGL